MSYQMMNALNIDSIPSVMSDTVEYVKLLKTDDKIFLDFLNKNKNFSNDYEPLIKICEKNPAFLRCDYFKERRRKIIYGYTNKIKFGKVLQNADNLVVVGSPYAMLMAASGLDPMQDPTFTQEDGAMQCWTERFGNGEYLAEFRSPFNSCNNLGLLHNVSHTLLDKYFPLGKQIIIINMIGTECQDRNNGNDMDSDSFLVTNQKDIVDHARYCMNRYHTIVNNIPKSKNTYDSSPASFAKVDNKLASSQLSIGESSNLAQLCLTYTYSFEDKIYEDDAAILAVVAQASIDSAKRTFDIDIPSEIKRIKEEINVKEHGYPKFWRYVRPDLVDKINKELVCPMNSVCDTEFFDNTSREEGIPFGEFLVNKKSSGDRRVSKRVESLINRYAWLNYKMRFETEDEDYILLQVDFENMIDEIRKITMGKKYDDFFFWLINRAFVITPQADAKKPYAQTTISKNKSLLMKTLYDINSELFLQQFCVQQI